MNTMNTIAQRRVVPELIDELPVHDPGAIHSRCDIRRINRVMGHVGIVASSLQPLLAAKPSVRLIELGAGDGTFLLRVAVWLHRRLPTPPVVEAWLVDRQPLLSIETVRKFARLGWKTGEVTSDVFDWLGKRAGPAAAAARTDGGQRRGGHRLRPPPVPSPARSRGFARLARLQPRHTARC